MTINWTRFVVGVFPLIWSALSYAMYRQDKYEWPNLPIDYRSNIILGLLGAFIICILIRVFIFVVIEKKEFP